MDWLVLYQQYTTGEEGVAWEEVKIKWNMIFIS